MKTTTPCLGRITQIASSLLVLLAAISPAGAAVQTPELTVQLSQATFTEWVGGTYCGATSVGANDDLPESVTVDYQNPGGQCVGVAQTMATGPQLDLQLDVSGDMGGQANARISYAFALVPTVADAPMENPVWVTTTVVAHASVASSLEGYRNDAGFHIQLPDPIGHPDTYSRDYVGEACSDGDPSNGPGCMGDNGYIPASAEVNALAMLLLPLGQELLVIKEGSIFLNHGSNGQGQVVADPLFQIAPGYFVDYNGVSTPTTDLYAIAYGEGVNVVPIPATAWLFGSGLAGLMALKRRRAA